MNLTLLIVTFSDTQGNFCFAYNPILLDNLMIANEIYNKQNAYLKLQRPVLGFMIE